MKKFSRFVPIGMVRSSRDELIDDEWDSESSEIFSMMISGRMP